VNFTVTAFPGRTFTGTVAAVEPAGTTTSNVVTYVVRISVDPTDVQLLPSMTAIVTIITQSAPDAVAVPNAAIAWAQTQPFTPPQGAQAGTGGQPGARQAAGGQPGTGPRQRNAQPGDPNAPNASVFVLRNGVPVRVPIQAGISDGVTTQVISGLQTGDQVITGTATNGSSRPSSSASGSGSIFNFGGPGGGGGGNNNRPAGQGSGQPGQGAPGGGQGAPGGGQRPGG